jgi:exopolyphosphatase / guanosine-5'-triphosphate,3'-diphosphate pyrophosphatase
MKIAVIDLGTNGFRLQIAETFEAGKFNIIHRESRDLKMASEGFQRIGDDPFKRGLEAMRHFCVVLKLHNVLKINAFGTAFLRLAENGADFMEAVKRETGIEIVLISGEREAELIYKGMRLGIPLDAFGFITLQHESIFEENEADKTVLMVDVGGGSVEFIIADADKMLWSKSFDIGVAVLKQRFHKNDPILRGEIDVIEDFLDNNTQDLLKAIATFQPKTPIIACGTLDFMVKILTGNNELPYFEFDKKTFQEFYQNLTFLDENVLKNTPNIPHDKVEMLAVSMVLMDWIMRKLDAEKMLASSFSMKAGMFYEMTF